MNAVEVLPALFIEALLVEPGTGGSEKVEDLDVIGRELRQQSRQVVDLDEFLIGDAREQGLLCVQDVEEEGPQEQHAARRDERHQQELSPDRQIPQELHRDGTSSGHCSGPTRSMWTGRPSSWG